MTHPNNEPLAKNKGKKKVRPGDRVWLRIPHNARVMKVYKDGSLQVELDPIEHGTLFERIDPIDVEFIK